jgi:hypothetical protein
VFQFLWSQVDLSDAAKRQLTDPLTGCGPILGDLVVRLDDGLSFSNACDTATCNSRMHSKVMLGGNQFLNKISVPQERGRFAQSALLPTRP